MSRDEGFAVADMDTAKHTDRKFRRLWRVLAPDEAAMNAATVLYEAVQLMSWRQGERIPVDDAGPFWITDPIAAAEVLIQVGLLDEEGMIPEHAWQSWYGPAYERREKRREAGRIGGSSNGQAPPKQPSSNAKATINPSVPSVPSVPTDRSVSSRAPARGGTGLAPITEFGPFRVKEEVRHD